jgi:hypothetical protein
MLFGEAPGRHNFIEPAVEFLVRHDLEKKMITDEPYLARLPDPCVAIDQRFVRRLHLKARPNQDGTSVPSRVKLS